MTAFSDNPNADVPGQPFTTPDNKRYQLNPGVEPNTVVAILFKASDLEDPKFGIGLTESATNARIVYTARRQAEQKGLISRR